MDSFVKNVYYELQDGDNRALNQTQNWGVLAYDYNPSTSKVEVGGSEFQYIGTPFERKEERERGKGEGGKKGESGLSRA